MGVRNVLGNLVVADDDTCRIHAQTRSLSPSPSSPLLLSFLVSVCFISLLPLATCFRPSASFLPMKWFNFRLSLTRFPVRSLLYPCRYVYDIVLTFFSEAN